MMAALPVYQKRGGSTRSNLFKSQALADYGSKPIDIGGLGHDYQSGILWSAYPINCGRLVRLLSSSDAEKARRNPPTRGASPPGASDPQESEGPFGSL
jgi:hypothetical protein